MARLKISEISEAPPEGTGRQLKFKHLYTEIPYVLGLFQLESKFYCITDQCRCCDGSLGKGTLKGIFVFCSRDECGWNVRKGYCKFNRSDTTPTYKVAIEEDGLYIDI
jgi:hypothetical protein